MAQRVKNLPTMLGIWFDPWVRMIPWRRDRLPTPVFLGFPGDSDGKESACSVGDLGSIPGLGRSPGRRHGNSLQYSCLDNLHGQRSLAGYSLWGHKESDWATKHSTCLSSICNWKINNSNAFEYQINKLRYKMLILVKIWQFHSLLPLAREDNKYNSCKSKVLICFKSFDIVHIILHSNSSSGNL